MSIAGGAVIVEPALSERGNRLTGSILAPALVLAIDWLRRVEEGELAWSLA